MADEYDRRMQELIEDDEGNQYTPEQVRAAAEAMARDERGEGSFGGLEEANEDPNADVDALVKSATTSAPAPERELNPMNFGKFFRDNIFSGSLGTGYVTGKRPMNLVDYATDVAIGYGGGDIGKRNAGLRQAAAKSEGQLSPLKAAEAGQNIKTGRAREAQAEAQTKKSRVEAEKVTGDLIQQIMNDTDSDLWAGEMKSLAKEHGVNLRPGIITMTERMATAMAEAGVKHPSEVLEQPDRFDPRLVNRVRHTMRLLNDQVQASQKAAIDIEDKQSAMGIREAEEDRKSREFEQQQSGYDTSLATIQQEIAAETDPVKKRQLENQAAAIQTRGTASQAVLQERAGTRTGEGRQLEFRGYLERAEEELGEGATPGAINQRAQELKMEDRAQATVRQADAKALAEKSRTVAEGLGQLGQITQEVRGTNMGQSGFFGGLKSRAKAAGSSVMDDPDVRAIDAVNSTLTNLARSLGGQKGVLSDIDTQMMIDGLGFKAGSGDTVNAWERRVRTFENIAKAGQRELAAAIKERRDPRRFELTADERKTFGAKGGGMPRREGAAGGGDKAAEAAAIRAETDPAKRQALAQEYMSKYGGGR